MKFTVETRPFVRLLELLVQSSPPRRHGERNLRLVAQRDRVCVQKDQAIAEIEAIVWSSGRCTVSTGKLLAVARKSLSDTTAIETAGEFLRVGGLQVPLVHYRPVAECAGRLQIYFASARGLVPSRPGVEGELAAAN